MFQRKLSSNILYPMLLALVLGGSAGLASAETLHVEIDTSTFGNMGWIDLSFLPTTATAASATATLSDFIGFDAATGADPWGNVSGSLAAGYTLGSRPDGADLFHAVNFGGKISFNVDFSGGTDNAVNRAQSTLSVTLFGADRSTPLSNGDPLSGSLLQLSWLPSKTSATPGTVSYQIFDSIVSVSPVSAVPEPSTWGMMGLGLGLIGLMNRRRKATAQLVQV